MQVDGTRADIWTGEIKSSTKSYKRAKQQLETRLDLLEWAVLAAWPGVTQVVRTGKIFIPRSSDKETTDKGGLVEGTGTSFRKIFV
jgi:hypothetical protein